MDDRPGMGCFLVNQQSHAFRICANVGPMDVPEVAGGSADDTFMEIFDTSRVDFGIA